MSEHLKATVDRAACKGHGRCYMVAPEIFDCDEEGFAVVIGDATTDAQAGHLQRAISNCPEQAVTAASA
jgi:ferredoxin